MRLVVIGGNVDLAIGHDRATVCLVAQFRHPLMFWRLPSATAQETGMFLSIKLTSFRSTLPPKVTTEDDDDKVDPPLPCDSANDNAAAPMMPQHRSACCPAKVSATLHAWRPFIGCLDLKSLYTK